MNNYNNMSVEYCELNILKVIKSLRQLHYPYVVEYCELNILKVIKSLRQLHYIC